MISASEVIPCVLQNDSPALSFPRPPYWQGEIHRLRFDYFNASAPGDVMYIKSIELT
jgi:hypothetical protein